MKISKRHRLIIIISFLILAILTGLSYAWSRQSVGILEKR